MDLADYLFGFIVGLLAPCVFLFIGFLIGRNVERQRH